MFSVALAGVAIITTNGEPNIRSWLLRIDNLFGRDYYNTARGGTGESKTVDSDPPNVRHDANTFGRGQT